MTPDTRPKTAIGPGVKIGPGANVSPTGKIGPGSNVGLIGLGLMGRPMGLNLLKAGYSLTVWNRTTSRAESLVAAGAKLASSPQEVAAGSDVLITIVSDPPPWRESSGEALVPVKAPAPLEHSVQAAFTLIPAPFHRP